MSNLLRRLNQSRLSDLKKEDRKVKYLRSLILSHLKAIKRIEKKINEVLRPYHQD